MIVALNTSTPTCELRLWDGTTWHDASWEAGRTLAASLHQHLADALKSHGKTFSDISGWIVFQGPGSFTGLRIGLTVANTFAHEQHVPIVGVTGEDWKETGLARLDASENDAIVLPLYGGDPHITQPRK